MTMSNNDNEVDLLEILALFISFLSRSFKVITSCFVMGILMGFFYFFVINPPQARFYFRKSTTVQSNQIPDNMMIEIINSIALKLKEEPAAVKNQMLADGLGLSLKVVNELRSISAHLTSAGLMEINIEAYDKQAVDSLIKGVEYYVLMNEYIKSRANFYRSQRIKLLAVLDGLIDGAKNNKIENSDFYESNASLIKLFSGRKSGFWNYLDLIELRQKNERELTFSRELDFVITNNPIETFDIYKEFYKKILGVGFFGIVIGITISFLLHYFKKINK